MPPTIQSELLSTYLVLVALLFGSFINLARDRVPRRESLVIPRSHCRNCGRQLNAIDLLPILGYLLRRGRCATCRAQIGISSPLVEAACGAAMMVALLWLGLWPGALAGLAVIAAAGVGLTTFAVRRRGGAE